MNEQSTRIQDPPNLTAALQLEALGFRVIPSIPPARRCKARPKPARNPSGAGGASPGEMRLGSARNSGSILAALGFASGQSGGLVASGSSIWKGTGPKPRDSLDTILASDLIETMGWLATRGSHNTFTVDGDRLLAALAAAGAVEGVGQRAGVWHLPELPDWNSASVATKTTAPLSNARASFRPQSAQRHAA